MDVRRQGSGSDPLEVGLDRGGEDDTVGAPLSHAGHLASEAVAEVERHARLRPSARLGEAVPRLRGRPGAADEKELHPSPLRVGPEEAGRDDAGVVHDEEVSRAEELGELRERAVPDRAVPPAQRHEAGSPSRRRPLGDGVRGEVVVEVGDVHGAILSRSARIDGFGRAVVV